MKFLTKRWERRQLRSIKYACRRSARGIPANALLAFVVHALAFDLIRRRSKTGVPHGGPEEIIALYELTPVGSYVIKVLEILTDITARV